METKRKKTEGVQYCNIQDLRIEVFLPAVWIMAKSCSVNTIFPNKHIT